MRLPALLVRALTNIALLAAIAIGAVMAVPAVLGMHSYVILTGSMTGTYDRGSIVFDRPVPVDSLRPGDPITYNPPPGMSPHERVTHRIVEVKQDRNGQRVFRTKGDANPVVDPWTFQLGQRAQDKVVFHLPYAGFALEVLSIRRYRMFLLGIPAVLIALAALRGLWIDARREAERQAAGWGEVGELVPDRPRPVMPQADPGLRPARLATLGPQLAASSRRRTAPPARPAVARGPRILRWDDSQSDDREDPERHPTTRAS
jgi:signal peptidase